MNIAMVTPRFVKDIRGGGEISCKLLVDTLRKLGQSVTVYSGDELFPKIQDTLKLNMAMYKYLKKKLPYAYDIVHTYNMSLLPTIGRLTKNYDLNSVGTLNGHVMSPTYEKLYGDHPIRGANIAKFLLKTQTVHIKQFTVLSECWRQMWIEDGIPKSKIRVIQNMNPENYVPLKHKKTDAINLLVVGNYAPWRNVKFILDAYAKLPKQRIVLTIVGAGWEKIIKNFSGVNKINYLRQVRRDLMNEIYAKADIYIQIFSYTGVGRSMLEAALNKIPLVANGNWNDYEKLSSAIIFTNTEDSLIYQLQTLIDDKKRRTALGKKAEEIVSKYFTPEAAVKKHIEVYLGLLQ